MRPRPSSVQRTLATLRGGGMQSAGQTRPDKHAEGEILSADYAPLLDPDKNHLCNDDERDNSLFQTF